MSNILISLPDGSAAEMPQGSTAADFVAAISPNLYKTTIAVKINGVLSKLDTPLIEDATIEIYTELARSEIEKELLVL